MQAREQLHHPQTQQKANTTPPQALKQTVGAALFFNQHLQLWVVILLTVLQKVMHQARQLRQQLGIARRFGAQLVPQFFGAHLFEHPLF